MIAMRAQHLKTQREITANCSGKGRGKGRIREEGREEDRGGVEAQKLHAARLSCMTTCDNIDLNVINT